MPLAGFLHLDRWTGEAQYIALILGQSGVSGHGRHRVLNLICRLRGSRVITSKCPPCIYTEIALR